MQTRGARGGMVLGVQINFLLLPKAQSLLIKETLIGKMIPIVTDDLEPFIG